MDDDPALFGGGFYKPPFLSTSTRLEVLHFARAVVAPDKAWVKVIIYTVLVQQQRDGQG